MANLKRDENRVTIGGALNATDLLTILPLKVDPVTGRLLIAIDICTTESTPPTKTSYIDENRVNASSAISDEDEATQIVMPLNVCTDDNYLTLDILFE